MLGILKTISLPLLFILPWAVMKLNNWDKGFQESIVSNPYVVIAILFPSALLTIRWVIKTIKK